MKSPSNMLMLTILLMLTIACGKENKSGNSACTQWGVSSCLGSGVSALNAISHPVVQAAVAQSPCSGLGGIYPSQYPPNLSYQNPLYPIPYQNTYGNQRVAIQVPINMPLSQGDTFIGLSSFGDIAVVFGNGPQAPATFIAYICPRSFLPPTGQGILRSNPDLRPVSYNGRCNFKPIHGAELGLPTGTMNTYHPIIFRDPAFGIGYSANPYQRADRPLTPFCRPLP